MNKRIYTTLIAAVLLLAATSANAQTSFIPEGWNNYQCTVLSETDKTAEIGANPDVEYHGGFYFLPDTVTNPATNTRYVVTRIAENGFKGKVAGTLSIENSIKSIGKNAFANGGVSELHVIPKNPPVLELSEDGSSPLKDVNSIKLYPQTISAYLQTDGWKDVNAWTFTHGDYWFDTPDYHNGELRIGSFVSDTISRPEKLEIPATVKIGELELTVTGIGWGAFGNGPFTEVIIPEGVTRIEQAAFSGCPELTKVTLPSKLEIMEGSVFKNCAKLADIHVPDGVTRIGKEAFAGTPFEAGFPDGPVYLGKVLYKYNGEIPAHYTIKDGTAEVGDEIFSDSKLETVKLPSSLEYCDESAFSRCDSLKNVDIPDFGPWFGIDFGNQAANPMFNNSCTLTVNGKTLQEVKELRIQEGITTLGYNSGLNLDMSGCKLVLPETFNDLGWTDALTRVRTAPDTLECYTPGVVLVSRFGFAEDFFNRTVLVVPAELVKEYKNDEQGWGAFKNITAVTHEENKFKFGIYSKVNRTASVVEYTDKTFAGEVVIPGSVTIGGIVYSVPRLADSAFSNSKITSVSIPESINDIDFYAFENCPDLKSVKITDLTAWCNIEMLNETSNPLCNGADLYLNGKIVEDLVIPDGISEIKRYTFTGTRSLKSVTVSDDVKKIREGAFFDCRNLKEITLGKNVEIIRDFAFKVSGKHKSQISKIRCNNPVPPRLGVHYASGEYFTAFMPETYETATVYVPVGSIDAYKAAEGPAPPSSRATSSSSPCPWAA